MTIQIPDDLAHGLEGIAAAQHKSVEQVAVESLRSLVNRPGSPEALLRAFRELKHPSAAAVDDLEAAIAAGRVPVRDEGAFD
jgi:predicted transcriptional regulator